MRVQKVIGLRDDRVELVTYSFDGKGCPCGGKWLVSKLIIANVKENVFRKIFEVIRKIFEVIR